MSNETRSYELKARAESQRETRERIARAAAELHEEVGVARTTVAEIARRAGVRRPTVYNHFPGLRELLPACSRHWSAEHPMPDFGPALERDDPEERLCAVLAALYGWYRETEPMMAKLTSDRAMVPELDEFMRSSSDPLQAGLAASLADAFAEDDRRDARRGARRRAEWRRALIAVAIDFATWQRLGREGLADPDAAGLMSRAVAAV